MIKIGGTSIGKVYVGANEITKAYVGTDVVYESGPSLPYDAQVEYLESNGNQYIDTGLVLDSINYVLELKFQSQYSGASNSESFVGFIAVTSDSCPRSGFHKYLSKWMFGTNSTNTTTIAVDKNEHTVKLESNDSTNKETLYLDGNLITQVSINTNGIAGNTLSYYAFGRNRANASNWRSKSRIMKLDITIYDDASYTNVVKQIKLIPVRKQQVGYMYDTVSGTLFGNQGAGNFVIGNDVN